MPKSTRFLQTKYSKYNILINNVIGEYFNLLNNLKNNIRDFYIKFKSDTSLSSSTVSNYCTNKKTLLRLFFILYTRRKYLLIICRMIKSIIKPVIMR